MGNALRCWWTPATSKPFDLMTLPVSQMGMAIAPFDKPQPVLRVQPLVIPASGKLLDTLAALPGVTVPDGADAASAPAVDGSDARPDGHAGADGEYGDQAMAGMDHGMMGHGDAERHGEYASRRHEHEPRIRHGAWHVVRQGL